MQRTAFTDMACSLARTLDIAGEWWTPLILRDIWLGRRRFEEIQGNLEVSRKLLAERLETLVREGIVERRLYQERPPRHQYRLTEKGNELVAAVVLPLIAWGDRWTAGEAGPPLALRHKRCGRKMRPEVRCSECGEPLTGNEVRAEAGPGARDDWGTRDVFTLPSIPG
jgi:DNA-binding HxlR family transcriptional regulator